MAENPMDFIFSRDLDLPKIIAQKIYDRYNHQYELPIVKTIGGNMSDKIINECASSPSPFVAPPPEEAVVKAHSHLLHAYGQLLLKYTVKKGECTMWEGRARESEQLAADRDRESVDLSNKLCIVGKQKYMLEVELEKMKESERRRKKRPRHKCPPARGKR